MITLFQRLADGELSLKSPRADPDAVAASEAASAAASTDARGGVGASVSGCLPPTAAGTGSPPRAPRRHGTASLRAYRPLRRNSGARRTEPCGGTGGQHAAVDMQGVVHGAHCFRRGIARFRGSGSSVSGENSSAPTSVRVGTGSRR
ncbi:MAG: hypothetical protein ACLT2T_07170 [Bilophila wadsworthia]